MAAADTPWTGIMMLREKSAESFAGASAEASLASLASAASGGTVGPPACTISSSRGCCEESITIPSIARPPIIKPARKVIRRDRVIALLREDGGHARRNQARQPHRVPVRQADAPV